MAQSAVLSDVREKVVGVKDGSERKFKSFTANFYVLKAALRYFKVKKDMSFTSSKLADNFPVSAPIAGSCLSILTRLGVVRPRTKSSSPDRYMPEDVDLQRLETVEEVLKDSYEIDEFIPDSE